MLSLRIEKLEDIAIIHCAGRLVFPYTRQLRIPLLRQLRTGTLVFDLVDTIAIDASGLGLLVSLRTWAKQTGRALKLMNVTPRVEQLLQLTKLKSEFEICSVGEMLDLSCRAIHQPDLVAFETEIVDSDVATLRDPAYATAGEIGLWTWIATWRMGKSWLSLRWRTSDSR